MNWSALSYSELEEFITKHQVIPDKEKILTQIQDLWTSLNSGSSNFTITIPVHDLVLAHTFTGTAPQKYQTSQIRDGSLSTLIRFAQAFGIPLTDPIDKDELANRVLRILRILKLVTDITPVNISKELSRYGYIQNMLYKIQIGLDRKLSYEAKNILERWLMGLGNIPRRHTNEDAIFSLAKLEDSLPQTKKMLAELNEKKISRPDQRLQEILAIGKIYLSLTNYPPLSPPIIDENTVIVEKYTRQLPEDRLRLLIDRADYYIRHNNLSTSPEQLIASMAIRYSCLLPGHQGTVPLPIYQYMVDRYKVTIEGFASPLNSQIIRLDNNKLKFCSLFLDTDAPFGSIGNFFTTDFFSHTVFANPPQIPELLNRMAIRINELCSDATKEGKSIRFFVIIPIETDAEHYIQLTSSPYKVFDLKLDAGTYYYENGDEQIVAKSNTQLLGIAVNVPDTYTDLTKYYQSYFIKNP